jgi:hypothetical protein
MSFLFENNAVSTLLAGITNVATTLTVQAGDGALFPNPTGGDSFRATLQDASDNIEIVDVTGRSGDVFTIVRGQEGTTGLAYLAGDVVELRLTKDILATYRQGVGDEVQTTAGSRAVGLSDVHDIIEVTAAATITLADAATMAEGYQIHIKNNSSATTTIARATGADTIDNVAGNMLLPGGDSVYLSVNATQDGYTSLYSAFDKAWPVGSIHLSTVATNPNTTLGGGTWVRIAEGRTLIGEGTGAGLTARTAGAELGAEAGAATVPEHSHTITDPGHDHSDSGAAQGDADGAPNGQNWGGSHQTGSATTGITIDNEGGTVDTNMQPSLVVYIWERTA